MYETGISFGEEEEENEESSAIGDDDAQILDGGIICKQSSN